MTQIPASAGIFCLAAVGSGATGSQKRGVAGKQPEVADTVSRVTDTVPRLAGTAAEVADTTSRLADTSS